MSDICYCCSYLWCFCTHMSFLHHLVSSHFDIWDIDPYRRTLSFIHHTWCIYLLYHIGYIDHYWFPDMFDISIHFFYSRYLYIHNFAFCHSRSNRSCTWGIVYSHQVQTFYHHTPYTIPEQGISYSEPYPYDIQNSIAFPSHHSAAWSPLYNQGKWNWCSCYSSQS